MQISQLKDRIARGLGVAARHIGETCDAFRPLSADCPTDPAGRFLRLPAAFSSDRRSFHRPIGYGEAVWSGIFDTAYTQPGDYLAGPAGVFFIAAQQDLMPSVCVLTNCTLDVSRAGAPAGAGVNGYGGITLATAAAVLRQWPASVLFAGGGTPGSLPGEASAANWTVLLPRTPVPIRAADLLTDETGRAFVVATAEASDLGWRLLARQANP